MLRLNRVSLDHVLWIIRSIEQSIFGSCYGLLGVDEEMYIKL